MGTLIVAIVSVLFLCHEIQPCICDNSSYPSFPRDPYAGGREGNPGAIYQFNQELLIDGVKEAFRHAEKEQRGKGGRGRSSDDDVVFDLPSGRFAVTDLILRSLSLPFASVDVSPPNLLKWSTDEARLSAVGSWSYGPFDDPTVNHTGNFYIPRTRFSTALNSTMGRTSENQPEISSVGCTAEFDSKSDFVFSSPSKQARLAIMDIESNLTEILVKVLESSMCDMTSYVLHAALNNVLSTFRTEIEIYEDPKVLLNYSLIADPYVDSEHLSINFLLTGAITVNDHFVNFFPQDMISLANDDKMSTTLFSDFLLNSLLASAHEADIFQSMNFDSTFSSDMAEFLSLDCRKRDYCVGSVFPRKAAKRGEGFAELSVSVTQSPSAVFLDYGGFLRVNGSFVIRVVNSTGRFIQFASPFSLVAVLYPQIHHEPLHSMLSMEAGVIEVNINNASPTQYEIRALMTGIFQDIINKPMRRGIPVPMFLNNKIVAPGSQDLLFHNRMISLHRYV